MIDIDAVRDDCPASKKIIHFNNAGCALAPAQVTNAVIDFLRLEQEIGGYEAAERQANQINRFYSSFASLLNCDAAEIAYVENATRAWQIAFHALALESGDHVITGDMEYASNYLDLLHYSRQRGIEISVIPASDEGLIDLNQLTESIKPNTRLICLTHVASQRGDVQPAQEVGRIAREHGLLYLLDACQSAGQIKLDVEEIGCDFLCGTGRKYLRGPRGTGFLYVKQALLQELQPTMIDLHSANWLAKDDYKLQDDATRFENWERYVAGCIGLAVASDYALNLGMENIEQRVGKLARQLHDSLLSVPGIRVLERSSQLSGIVTFYKEDEDAATLRKRLLLENINTSVSRLGNAQLDLPESAGVDINRASVHYYNTEEEIERFSTIVAAAD